MIFGGVLVPSEHFSAELWTYNFSGGNWDITTWHLPADYTSDVDDDNATQSQNASGNGTTTDHDSQIDKLEEMYNNSMLPFATRGHTAHIIGTKMLVFFGIIHASESQPSLTQELNLGKEISEPKSLCYNCQLSVILLYVIEFHLINIL